MSEDRVGEIKKWLKGNYVLPWSVWNNITWLISELEKCREENQLLNALFDMQQTRMKKAIKLWQRAIGKKDVLPDLGVLLEWLMEKMA